MMNIQVRKYIDTPFELIETPLLDDYLNFQFADKDGVIEFIYFMCGRALTKIEDRFDFMLFLYGQPGSGKSELLELIKYSYGVNQVSNLKSSFEKTFGLSAVAKSQIFVSDDMPINVANVFSKDNFLSMITRGSIPCPVKNGTVIEIENWDVPIVWNSNYLPNYSEDSGEITRRIMMVEFDKIVPPEKKDLLLGQKIKESEYATFIHRCCTTFLRMSKEHYGKCVTTFCPEYFLDKKDDIREQSNKLFSYLKENTEYCEQSHTSMSELRKQYNVWLAHTFKLEKIPRNDKKLSINTISMVDSRYIYRKSMICKFCKDKHKKGCCGEYKREARTITEIVENLRIKSIY
jgi:phage/plasmid-associated DNA primase